MHRLGHLDPRLDVGPPQEAVKLRLVSWNVENMTRFLRAPGEILARFGTPDVLCMQEIRVRPQDGPVLAEMTRALPGYDCH